MFNWEDFLTLARKLANSTEESELRTSISRTYYSMYHRSKDFCMMKGIPTPPILLPNGLTENSDHMKLIRGMRAYSDTTKNYKKVTYAGKLLDNLRSLRKHADYKENPIDNIEKETINAISTADEIIKTLNRF